MKEITREVEFPWEKAVRPGLLSSLLISLFLPLSVLAGQTPDFGQAMTKAALERTGHTVRYDGQYRAIAYPGGDVPNDTGVCTDVIIRSYRALGIDLQKEVHEEMKAHFQEFPDNWGLKKTDPNIDHRRVPNLQVFFKRRGTSLKVTRNPKDYRPGDLVTWLLDNNLPHIGIVVDRISADGKRHLIVHNIGAGPKLEDRLFDFKITGHYRYTGNWSPPPALRP